MVADHQRYAGNVISSCGFKLVAGWPHHYMQHHGGTITGEGGDLFPLVSLADHGSGSRQRRAAVALAVAQA